MRHRLRKLHTLLAGLTLCATPALAADFKGEMKGELACFSPAPAGALQWLCVDYQMRWRVFSLMGEPVVNAVLTGWKVREYRLKTPSGKLIGSFESPPEVRAALARLELQLVLDAAVLGSRSGGLLRLDSGVATRQTEPSFNVPGSPDWTRLFHINAPVMAPSSAANMGFEYRCAKAPEAWVPVAEAKNLLRGDFKLATPSLAGGTLACGNLSFVGSVDALTNAMATLCEKKDSGRPGWCLPLKPERVASAPAAGASAARRDGTCGAPADAMDAAVERRAGARVGSTGAAGTRSPCGPQDALDAAAQRQASAASAAGVDPRNADALSRALRVAGGAASFGDMPAAGGSDAPRIRALASNITTSNGSTAQVPFECKSALPLRATYVQVVGANRHLRVASPTAGAACDGEVALSLPTNLEAGDFCVTFSVEDTAGRVSNAGKSCLSALKLGSGTLQVSLSWNTAGTDVDLAIVEPGGNRISFSNRKSKSGGALDRDDRDGFGPENIFWDGNAPDGEYAIEVTFYSGGNSTGYVVTLNAAGGNSQTKRNSLSYKGEKDTVFRFVKTGDRISFR